MIVTGILAAFVVFSISAGALVQPWPLVLGGASGLFLFFFGRHSHGGEMLVIDMISRKSRFFKVNPDLKIWSFLVLLFLCIFSKSPWPALILFFLLAVLTVAGGVKLHEYLSLLSWPAVFLLLSALALLWNYSEGPAAAVLKIPFFGHYLILKEEAQVAARLVMSRALGAVSCLYFLNLSTSMPEILAVFRRAKVPAVIIDLAVLVYRYIFIILSTCHSMKNSAASRLGYGPLSRNLRTTGLVYRNLLLYSFRRAGNCFDAMESRGYDGELRFLERKKPVRPVHVSGCILLIVSMALAVFLIP